MKWNEEHTHTKTVNANYSASNECINMQFFYIYNAKVKNKHKLKKNGQKIKKMVIQMNKQTI